MSTVKFKFVFEDSYNPVYCNGAMGGIQPNGENSKTIDSNILSKAKYLIGILAIQPDIYPTPRGTIQFEYYKNNNYLEFEIFPAGTKMLKVINNEPYETILHHSFDINKEVNAFYES